MGRGESGAHPAAQRIDREDEQEHGDEQRRRLRLLEDREVEVEQLAEATGAESASKGERIQSLWSGYGELFRVSLQRAANDARASSAIVKWVKAPTRDRGDDRRRLHAATGDGPGGDRRAVGQ